MATYDSMAPGYNALHGEEQTDKARIIAAHLQTSEGDSILDVGCGTGLGSQFLKGKKTGIDPSIELIKQCPFNAIAGNAEALPFPDKSFDITVCVSAVHNFDDAKKGLEEIARVTRRTVAISVLKKSQKASSLEILIRDIFGVTAVIDQRNDKIFIASIRQ